MTDDVLRVRMEGNGRVICFVRNNKTLFRWDQVTNYRGNLTAWNGKVGHEHWESLGLYRDLEDAVSEHPELNDWKELL
jgi:hypothetical protein